MAIAPAFREWWEVPHWHVECSFQSPATFHSLAEAEKFAKDYIAGDPKYYRAEVKHFIAIEHSALATLTTELERAREEKVLAQQANALNFEKYTAACEAFRGQLAELEEKRRQDRIRQSDLHVLWCKERDDKEIALRDDLVRLRAANEVLAQALARIEISVSVIPWARELAGIALQRADGK